MTIVEIVLLGTTASIPTVKRNHPSIYIRYIGRNEYCFLFDCGEGTQRQIFKAGLNFMRINHIFITHWHADHFAGLFGLIETMSLEARKKPLYIFGPEANKFIPLLKSLGYAKKRFEIVAVPVRYEGNKIETLIENDEFKICSTPVKHGIPAVAYAFIEKDRIKLDKEKLKALGLPLRSRKYKFLKEMGEIKIRGKKIKLTDVSYVEKGKKIVYSGDTKPCQTLVKLAEDADCLIIDSTFFEENPEDWLEGKQHMNVREAVEIGTKARVKKLVLTHISRRYTNEKELENQVKKLLKESKIKDVAIGKDFMKIIIK